MKVCPMCFSDLKCETTIVENVYNNKKLHIKNVPTLSCMCGENFFNMKVVTRLNDLTLEFGIELKELEELEELKEIEVVY